MERKNFNKFLKEKPEEIVTETPVEEERVDIEEIKPQPTSGIVKSNISLNVRKGPTTAADILMILKAGSKVTIIDTIGEFYKITISNGMIGYVMKKYIEV